jgi:mono/diheme cytochrome c family protein
MVRLGMVLASFGVAVAAAQTARSIVMTRSVRDGIYTSEQADRGKALYARHCASCHMLDLRGLKASPGKRDGVPALQGGAFTSNWTDLSVDDLFVRIRVSMPQNAPGSLSRQQNADILAYVLQQNGYALGLDELPTVNADLGQIRFEP